ncbi:lanthionine synthetase C family protein [Saccharothrix sp. BKS2]|uniref:lanthionine synthetase C family protein n=1 Tax=Saccharothrix sp. BKS2 TaxID=3064400 RepID=UPI0039E792E2
MTSTNQTITAQRCEPSPFWRQSLASGAAGIALLHIADARAGRTQWPEVHRRITVMTHDPVTADTTAGLFHGAPAVAFVLRHAAHPAYATALGTLDRHISDLVARRLAVAHQRIDQGLPPRLGEFDLINGLTGIGAYLLLRRGGREGPVREVLAYLVRLATEPVFIDGRQLPGWCTLNAPNDRPSPQWPGGHTNLGIAHGIAGPLALLAHAAILGTTVPGHVEAIDRICSWLDHWRSGPQIRPWWPGLLRPEEWHRGSVDQPGPQRPSWCYGTPGMARAQQLAAMVLHDRHRQQAAEHALATCVTDPDQLALLGDASLCHGWAGLVQTTRRTAADAGPDSALAALLPHLNTRFTQQHPHTRQPATGDGLLEGTTGIELTQHPTPGFAWDACLLIASPTPGTPDTEGIG